MRLIAVLALLGLVGCGPTLPPTPPAQPRETFHFVDDPAEPSPESQDAETSWTPSLDATNDSPSSSDVTGRNPHPPTRVDAPEDDHDATPTTTVDPRLHACEELARADASRYSEFSVSFAIDHSDTDVSRAMRRRQLFEACIANTIGMAAVQGGTTFVEVVPPESEPR